MRVRIVCWSYLAAVLCIAMVAPHHVRADAARLGCTANGLTPVQGSNWGNGLSGTWRYIAGDPLLIAVGNTGSMAVWVCQPPPKGIQYQYYGKTAWGTNIWLNGTDTAKHYSTSYYGNTNGGLTAVSQVTSTAGADTIVTTVMNLGANAQLRQIVTYTAGSYGFKRHWELTNNSGSTMTDLRLFHGGDTYFGGDDQARSWWNPSQNMVYVNNSSFLTSGTMGFYGAPATPAARYFSGSYSSGRSQASSTAELSNTSDSNYLDAGYQLQWNRATLAAGATWTIEAFEVWTDPTYVSVLAPADQLVTPNSTVTLSFDVHNLDSSEHTLNVSASTAGGWTTSIVGATQVVVPALTRVSVPVEVVVPADAVLDSDHRVTLTASDSTASGSSSTNTTVFVPSYTLTPLSLVFGTATVGSTPSQTITLSNTGSAVQVGTVGSPNGLVAPFSIVSDTCSSQTIANGASCAIDVRFTPSAAASSNDVFNIPVLAPQVTSYNVSVSGTGIIDPCASPNALGCSAGDYDADGISNGVECTNISSCEDTDGDGTPNYQDSDSDQDGVNDAMEANAAASTNACLPSSNAAKCTSGDADGDGVLNGVECTTPLTTCADTDGDGTPDYQDTDADNDGSADNTDSNRTNPCLPLTTAAYCTTGDADMDGVTNAVECPTRSSCVDSDGDGTPDFQDTDSDGDGALDGVDSGRTNACAPSTLVAVCASGDADSDGRSNGSECPTPAACVDSDGDGTPNFQDTDSDNDGTLDNTDATPVNPCLPSSTVVYCTTGDYDGDSVTNGTECVNPAACADSDSDGTPDYRDSDSDNDGSGDTQDAQRTNPCSPSGVAAACTTGDADSDGILNGLECPNALACADSDGDGTPNYQDTDSDNDGTADATDSNRTNPCAPSTAAAYCSSGDADMDGVTNGAECPSAAACVDSDGDGTPDFQDTDSDGDGALDSVDSVRTNPCAPSTLVAACSSGDADSDGRSNGSECPTPTACGDGDSDGTPDFQDADSDNDGTLDDVDSTPGDPCQPSTTVVYCGSGDYDDDGITNGAECINPMACSDSDGDGTPDYRDSDSDNDGSGDAQDADRTEPCLPNGLAAACTTGDADSDGILNGLECLNALACADSDSDGTPDYQDTDTDNDGTADSTDTDRTDPCAPRTTAAYCTSGDTDMDGVANAAECPIPAACADSDGDGTPDFQDTDSDGDGELDSVDTVRTNPCAPSTLVAVCTTGDADSDGRSNGTECPVPTACGDGDSDGTPDFEDADSDNDGTLDDVDSTPGDPCEPSTTVVYCGSGDFDEDGITNGAECINPMACSDSDGDGTPDYRDSDSDNDGSGDAQDAQRTDPCLPSDAAAACAIGDTDGDGILNGLECLSALGCADSDGDGTPDYQDTDSDNDGTADNSDSSWVDPCAPSTAAAYCSSGDADMDGVSNGAECPNAASCADSDGDGTPDFQDTDSDGDGALDSMDSVRTNPCDPSTLVAACSSGDADSDGRSNASECPIFTACGDGDGDGTPDFEDADSDNDGTLDDVDSTPGDPCEPSTTAVYCGRGDSDEDGITNGAECINPMACSDSDGDGTPDYQDSDSDNDGTEDDKDAQPTDPCSPSDIAAACTTGDTDGDGIPNGLECLNALACLDSDADGTPDYQDTDSDNDGQTDDQDDSRVDPCAPIATVAACAETDTDADGTANGLECPNPLSCPDTDDDGTPDYQDTDADGDGVADATDENRTDPCIPSTLVGACGSGDADEDGVLNGAECENPRSCPDGDGDGTPDYQDTDADGDGTPDADDGERLNTCVPASNVPACLTGDADEDGIVNGAECQSPTSCADTDGDGTPDYQDTDADADGTPDATDTSPIDTCAPATSVVTCASGDADNDGVLNGAECANPAECPDTDGDGAADYLDTDSDDDGTQDGSDDQRVDACAPNTDPAACETGDADDDGLSNASECPDYTQCPDNDGDGEPDFEDTDSDGDGAADSQECSAQPCADADEDGLPNYLERHDRDSDGDGTRDDEDQDADGDGTPDGTECATPPTCADSDSDGIPDQADAANGGSNDSDADGVSDDDECGNVPGCLDSDGDHIPDYADTDSDGDGDPDASESEPTNPCSPSAAAQACVTGDPDADGITNAVECSESGCPDTDGDELNDNVDPDSDNDGTPDQTDSARTDPCQPNLNALKCPTGDFDADGVDNTADAAPSDACMPNGMAEACGTGDTDGDGVLNSEDPSRSNACAPSDKALACGSGDTDGDGKPNNEDSMPSEPCVPNANALKCGSGDADGDGKRNSEDTKPSDACVPSANVLKCGTGDTDADGVKNKDDASPTNACAPNADALKCGSGDTDGDGVPNAEDEDPTNACAPSVDVSGCDAGDIDGDGVPNGEDEALDDACLPDANAARCTSGDADSDGIPNGVECPNPIECRDSDDDGTPDLDDDDDDGDGVSTKEEDKNSDGDPSDDDSNDNGIPDYLDQDNGTIDSDGDGQDDAVECGDGDDCLDTDNDGQPNNDDNDDDGDGLSTSTELKNESKYGADVDHDGIPNHLDSNSDGDRIPDDQELGDSNYNGVPDYLERTSMYAGDDDGCSVAPSARRDFGALWLMPLFAWLVLRRRKQHLVVYTVLFVLAWSHTSRAEDVQLSASAHDAISGSVASDAGFGPAAGSFEIGLFGGVFLPSSKHELYDSESTTLVYQKVAHAAPEFGLRGAWFPLRFLGAELEGALLPSQTRDTEDDLMMYALRGHLLLQAPLQPITPFLLAGGGLLGLSSGKRVLGSDLDGTGHIGLGVKAYVARPLVLRLEVRDNLTQGFGRNVVAMHWEVLLGVSMVLGPFHSAVQVVDADGDSVPDAQDACPDRAGFAPLGCPKPSDQDGDGVADEADTCLNQAGVASNDPGMNGCPPPPADADGDGVADVADQCPVIKGDGPDGCLQDGDADGIARSSDKCPEAPETRNNYEDADGCPDELPQVMRRFSGSIAGIAFDSGTATIQASSYPTLDEAAKLLSEYEGQRVEITGHTDTSGSADSNLKLSSARAEAVKTYLTGKGVAAHRLQTRGAGSSEPIADNNTKEGRSKNRRIDFKLLQNTDGAAPVAP